METHQCIKYQYITVDHFSDNCIDNYYLTIDVIHLFITKTLLNVVFIQFNITIE